MADCNALVPRAKSDVLANNTFAIVHGETTVEDKLIRLVGLVPMALEVADEARDTIARLRTEVEDLRAENQRLRMELGMPVILPSVWQ